MLSQVPNMNQTNYQTPIQSKEEDRRAADELAQSAEELGIQPRFNVVRQRKVTTVTVPDPSWIENAILFTAALLTSAVSDIRRWWSS